MKGILALLVCAAAFSSGVVQAQPNPNDPEAVIRQQKQDYMAWYSQAAAASYQTELQKRALWERQRAEQERIAFERDMAWYRAETERIYADSTWIQARGYAWSIRHGYY